MKKIGFLTKHGLDKFAKNLEDLISDDTNNPKIENIIAYLRNGVLCVPFMGIVDDEERNDDEDPDYIGYLAVYTDGEWCWPEYFVGYLIKYPNYKIDDAFVKHVEKNLSKKIELSEERIGELEKEFLKEAGFK